MRMSILIGAIGAAAVVCGSASATEVIAWHTAVVKGNATPEDFSLDMFLALNGADGPGSGGYLGGGTLTLIDFFNGTLHTLIGDLAGAAAVLTNGVDNEIFYGAGLPDDSFSLSSSLESVSFVGQPGIIGPDLTGYIITEVSVIGSGFQSDEDYNFEATVAYRFSGTRVPAPGAGVLAALAGATLIARRRRTP